MKLHHVDAEMCHFLPGLKNKTKKKTKNPTFCLLAEVEKDSFPFWMRKYFIMHFLSFSR